MDKITYERELIETEMKYTRKIKHKAWEVHANTNQTYDVNKPYGVHLDRVYDFVVRFGQEFIESPSHLPVVVFAAYFHDSIEDARLTYNDLKKIAAEILNGLSEEDITWACDIVYALTNEKGKTRIERENDKYFEGIRKIKYASFVKACDRLANLSYSYTHGSWMYKVYKKEMINFLSLSGIDLPDSSLKSLLKTL